MDAACIDGTSSCLWFCLNYCSRLRLSCIKAKIWQRLSINSGLPKFGSGYLWPLLLVNSAAYQYRSLKPVVNPNSVNQILCTWPADGGKLPPLWPPVEDSGALVAPAAGAEMGGVASRLWLRFCRSRSACRPARSANQA
jgi:hypothetical protein